MSHPSERLDCIRPHYFIVFPIERLKNKYMYLKCIFSILKMYKIQSNIRGIYIREGDSN